jgi:D-alanyl-D-alanine carboxypeptidase
MTQALPLPPASLTKIMTALIVVARGRRRCRRDGERTRPGGGAEGAAHRLGVAACNCRRATLLAAMLLRSANDACLALAEHRRTQASARSSRAMNRAPSPSGLPAPTSTMRCGFDGPRHRASASDLARLAHASHGRCREWRAIVGRCERGQARTTDGRVFEVRQHQRGSSGRGST